MEPKLEPWGMKENLKWNPTTKPTKKLETCKGLAKLQDHLSRDLCQPTNLHGSQNRATYQTSHQGPVMLFDMLAKCLSVGSQLGYNL